jgi:hypothetical protein
VDERYVGMAAVNADCRITIPVNLHTPPNSRRGGW